ncbi:MAG: hypothetical protein ACI9YB_002196, partial [Halioglobus sp.]
MDNDGFGKEAQENLYRLRESDASASFFFHVGMWAETRLWDQEARFFYFQASALDKDYQLPKFTFGHFFATEASKIMKMLH